MNDMIKGITKLVQWEAILDGTDTNSDADAVAKEIAQLLAAAAKVATTAGSPKGAAEGCFSCLSPHMLPGRTLAKRSSA